MGDPAEEFEAIWAVVRRLEARIRRLEATIAELRAQLATAQAATAEPQPALATTKTTLEPTLPTSTEPAAAEPPAPFDPVDGPVSEGGPYRLVFDGGSLGNPGKGYGSFHITSPRGGVLHEQLSFDERGDTVTNNQAEYLTLIHALDRLQQALGERVRTASVEIRGDSQLVIHQLNGRWKVRNEDLRPLHERARSLLARFGHADLRWHDRSNSVELLGH